MKSHPCYLPRVPDMCHKASFGRPVAPALWAVCVASRFTSPFSSFAVLWVNSPLCFLGIIVCFVTFRAVCTHVAFLVVTKSRQDLATETATAVNCFSYLSILEEYPVVCVGRNYIDSPRLCMLACLPYSSPYWLPGRRRHPCLFARSLLSLRCLAVCNVFVVAGGVLPQRVLP